MNLYFVYYNQQDKAVCVERQGTNGIIKIIAGVRPTSLYSRMLVTDTYALSEAIDESLLTKQEQLNKSKGMRYQRTPELEQEIKLGCSHSVLHTVIPPFFGALKSRGHAACAKRCFGV